MLNSSDLKALGDDDLHALWCDYLTESCLEQTDMIFECKTTAQNPNPNPKVPVGIYKHERPTLCSLSLPVASASAE